MFLLFQKHMNKVHKKSTVAVVSSLKFWTFQKQIFQCNVRSQNAFKHKLIFTLPRNWLR